MDMVEEMEKDAIELAIFAMMEYLKEWEMAAHIKKEMDKKYKWVPPSCRACACACTPPGCERVGREPRTDLTGG